MKSLRKKFITNIVVIFLIVLLIMFFLYAFEMHGFFSNTITDLDVIENKLLADEINAKITIYKNAVDSLALNANLADMLDVCKTAEEFNSDHNFGLVLESMERTRASMGTQSSRLWTYSVDNGYMIQTGGPAKAVILTEEEQKQVNLLRNELRTTMMVEYTGKDGISSFVIVTPTLKDGRICGLAGTEIDPSLLLREARDKAGKNNMVTDCALVIPELSEDFSVVGYNEFYLKDETLQHNRLPIDFQATYPDGIQTGTGPSHEQDGERYLAELGTSGWYFTSFVPNETVTAAFIASFTSTEMIAYFFIMLAVLAGVWWIACKLTQPLQDLSILVSNLRAGKSYERLKGNNEITQAADSLIAFAQDNMSLLAEIRELAQEIESGRLLMRFDDGSERNLSAIKLTFNQMLDSISRMLDTLPAGIAIVDEDHKLIYLNKAIRQIIGVREEDVRSGCRVEDLERLNPHGKNSIISEIENCKKYGSSEAKLYAMEKHISFVTTNFEYSRSEDKKQLFLQVYQDQTALIQKIQEQEQIFAYFEHLSLVKKEALERLAKGDFKRATIEIGERPSASYLCAIYDDQMEMKRAFQQTVDNIESIITRMGEATRAFAQGNLHSVIDAQNAKGKYAELVGTANNAFDVILNYFQSIPVPIRIIGTDHKIKFFNQAAYASGFRPGKDVRCYHLYDEETPCENCPQLTNKKELTIRDYVCKRGEQTSYWKSYRNPLMDEKGNLTSVLEIRIDETEVVELKKAADSANMAKSKFIASMSHEIRTPMNAILGYAQLLEYSKNLDQSEREYIDMIRRSGNHLLNLINDILEMSKIEAGKITINEQPFDLRMLFADARGMFAAQMEAKGLTFHVQEESVLCAKVVGDVGKVRQIIFNVISNAIKFTSQGAIMVEAKTEERPDDHILLTVDIQDTGVGIAKEEWNRVFEAFEQTKAGSNSGVGTGLGMAISRNFARMMKGDLVILRSQPGMGSTFRLELLLKRDQSEAVAQDVEKNYARVAAILQPCTVLVADRDANSRAILRQHLARLGFVIVEAEEDEQAYRLWDTHPPDVLICDSFLNTERLALVRRIRETEKNMHTPVIVLTADAMDQSRSEALLSGADVFMTKPFIVEQLLRELEKLTQVRYRFEELAVQPEAQANTHNESIPEAEGEQIKNAVLRGDFDAVIKLAESLSGDCPAISAQLIEYADDFDGNAIMEILKRSQA